MKKGIHKVVGVCLFTLALFFTASCQNPLVSMDEIPDLDQEQNIEGEVDSRSLVSGGLIREVQNNFDSGLFWYNMAPSGSPKALFNTSKPMMIFIHGYAWSSGTISDKRFNSNTRNDFVNQGSGFQTAYSPWNLAIFNWKDANIPADGYNIKSTKLANDILSLVNQYNLNNTEIRLVSYSWGIHVATPAAKKILQGLGTRKILVTIDYVDPVTEHGWLESSLKSDLDFVVKNQKAALKSGSKLVGLAVRKAFGFGSGEAWDNKIVGFGHAFGTMILPSVQSHVQVHYKGADHWEVLKDYHKSSNMRQVRFDSTSWSRSYTSGSNQLSTRWIEGTEWLQRLGSLGPMMGTEIRDIQRHYQNWYIKTAGYWKDVFWYSYTEWYLSGWTWKSRTKNVYKKVWVDPVWAYTWEPYPLKEKVLGHYVWNFM